VIINFFKSEKYYLFKVRIRVIIPDFISNPQLMIWCKPDPLKVFVSQWKNLDSMNQRPRKIKLGFGSEEKDLILQRLSN